LENIVFYVKGPSGSYTKEETAAALKLAHRRYWNSREQGREDQRQNKSKPSLAMDEEGTLAELPARQILGVPWDPDHVDKPKSEPDIPPDWEVRSTTWESGCLIIRPKDMPYLSARRYVLVIVRREQSTWRIAGMIDGRGGLRDEWHRDKDNNGDEAWWVPQWDSKKFPPN
jgi:hypothetical protein